MDLSIPFQNAARINARPTVGAVFDRPRAIRESPLQVFVGAELVSARVFAPGRGRGRASARPAFDGATGRLPEVKTKSLFLNFTYV